MINCVDNHVLRFLCVRPFQKWVGLLYMSKFSNTDVHRPCNNMVTILGMPKYYRPDTGTAGTARLYVNNIVKVTEDFISYDLLRYVKMCGK